VQQTIIAPRMSVPILANYIQTQRFVVTIVTCTESKRVAILEALKQMATPVFFRVEVVSDLIHLLPGGM
jgi:hypothetical protein